MSEYKEFHYYFANAVLIAKKHNNETYIPQTLQEKNALLEEFALRRATNDLHWKERKIGLKTQTKYDVYV